MKKLLLAGLLFGLTAGAFAPAAEAHRGHRHRHPRSHRHRDHTFVLSPWGFYWDYSHDFPRNVRLNEHCVYKPHKDKTICRY